MLQELSVGLTANCTPIIRTRIYELLLTLYLFALSFALFIVFFGFIFILYLWIMTDIVAH